MPSSRLRTIATPVPGVQIWYDFVTRAEEEYLIQKIDSAGGDPIQPHPEDDSTPQDKNDENAEQQRLNDSESTIPGSSSIETGPPIATTATTDGSAPRARKAWGWKDLNGRRSMYWGGPVLPSGSLIPAPFPSFMDSTWPNVLDRIAETGVYDAWTGGEGKGKARGANHCLVNEYLPGQGIMPHTDGPAYLPCTSTLSLGSHTILHLRSKPAHLSSPSSSFTSTTEEGDQARTASIAQVQKIDLFLPARSLVVLTSELYCDWLHGIAPIKGDSVESLTGCANWEDWWDCQREDHAGDSTREREMVEAGKGWERQRRISLTCRRVKGKVRNLGGLLGRKAGR
ncbi:hypothetical protein JCM10908_000784 [Rhodotorula pacifica]|uniref:uncharacterized protein n=1 Tax=Rhodotorula pacifica TaxID=1495444 RepID=UPI0031816E64